MQTSWQHLVNTIEAFASDHLQIKRFDSDFFEQLDSFEDKEELFPLMYVVPPSGPISGNVGTFNFDVYVLDQITEGRENITTIVSDAHLILNDLFTFIEDSYDTRIDVTSDGNTDSVNNTTLNGLAGAVMNWSVEGQLIVR